jgi:hypothetical protein
MVQQLRDEQEQERGHVESAGGRDAPALEVPGLHAGSGLTCEDCKHCAGSYFLACRYFDKPTSGEINGCPGFAIR